MASQTAPRTITLKIFSEGVAVRRRVDAGVSFAGIQAIIGDAGLPVPPKFSLATFVDEDGDTIRLSNDEDLADALSVSPSVLKITLKEIADAPRAPVVAVPASQPKAAPAAPTPAPEEEVEEDDMAAFMAFVSDVSGKFAGSSPEVAQVLEAVQETLPSLAMCSNPDDVVSNLQAMRKAVEEAVEGATAEGEPTPANEGGSAAGGSGEEEEWALSTPVVPCARSCALLFRELKVYLSSLKMLVKHPRFGTFTARAFQLLPTLSQVVAQVCAMDLSSEEARTAAIAKVADSGVVLPIIELFVAVFGDIGVTTVSCNQDVLLRAGFSAAEVAAAVEAGVSLGSTLPADSLGGKPMKVAELLDSIWAMAAGECGGSSGEEGAAAPPPTGPYPGKVSEDGRTVWVAGLPSGEGEQTVHLSLDVGAGGEGVAASDFRVELDGDSGLWKITAPEGKTVRVGTEHSDRADCRRRRGEMRAWCKKAQQARCAIRDALKCPHSRWTARCKECTPEAAEGSWRHGRRGGRHHGRGCGRRHGGGGRHHGRGCGRRHGGRGHFGGPKRWMKDAAAMAAMAPAPSEAAPPAHTATPPDAEDMLLQAAIAASMSAGRTQTTASVASGGSVTTTAPMGAPTSVLGDATAVTAAAKPPAVVQPPTVASVSGSALDTDAPSAKFLAHVTVCPEGALKPGQTFIKAWRMQNSGGASWPEGCRIVHVGGHPLGVPAAGQEVPTVAPGDSVDISLRLEAPAYPGRHVGYYRLVTPSGTRFGHRIWQHMVVDNSNAADVLATLRRQGSLPPAADADTQTSPRKPSGINQVTPDAGDGSEDFVVVSAPDAVPDGRVSLKARSRSGTAGTEESFQGACGSASMEASLSDVGTPVAAPADALPATVVDSTLPADPAPADSVPTAAPISDPERAAVDGLVAMLGVGFAPALAALRQAGGDANRAADLLLAE